MRGSSTSFRNRPIRKLDLFHRFDHGDWAPVERCVFLLFRKLSVEKIKLGKTGQRAKSISMNHFSKSVNNSVNFVGGVARQPRSEIDQSEASPSPPPRTCR